MIIFLVGAGFNLIFFVFLIHNYLIHIIIKVFILRKSVNHSPSLFSQLSYQLENRNFILFLNDFLANTHGNKCSCSSNTCTTVNNWRLTFLIISQKFAHQKINWFIGSFKRSISIRPTRDLIMCEYCLEVIVYIFYMKLSYSKIILLILRDHFDLILFFNHFSSFSFLVGPVTIALFPIFLN